MKKVLFLTDNQPMLERFIDLVKGKPRIAERFEFSYAYSYNNASMAKAFAGQDWIKPVKVKAEVPMLVQHYSMIFSLHCKQIFPAELVNRVKCINVHPGLNPYNRGWYPQVFSILNKLPAGATIHEIDEHLDHGPVICQKEVKIEKWDTSFTAYNKVLDAEIELLDERLESILDMTYTTQVKEEGNLNLKKDFNALCEIDLTHVDSFGNHIDRLRALTHGDYMNAYYIDENGVKVYVKIELLPEKQTGH